MGKTLTLLIVDDNEELLTALDTFFSYKGYTVVTAQNGLEALKLFENKTTIIDLLITDLVMPHVSGVGLISIIKKKYPELPIIAVTGWGEFPEALAAEAQADRVLKKPFQLVELESVVKELLASAKSG